MRHIYIGV